MSETTLSAPITLTGIDGARGHLLFVAHHADRSRVGEGIVLGPGALELGRDSDALHGLLAGDPWLSRRHATLTVGERCVLRDQQSRNGTFVNAAAVAERTLEDRDVLRLGDLLLVYRAVDRGLDAARLLPGSDALLVGVGPPMMRVLEVLDAVATRSSPVLLTGPPGVGKGLVARALHARSDRRGPLVTFDCGAVVDGVAQSELFGHTSGAFSGADRARPGLVEQARGGTLFLDEIGDASPVVQSSLLRLLEEGEVRAVGSDRPVRADVRIVAATNRDLSEDAERGKFRFDLLTRLRRWVVDVPPLSDRPEDIGLLALRKAEAHASKRVKLGTSLVESLLLYPFPGNVRELDAIMERVVVEGRGQDVLRLPPGVLRDGLARAFPEAREEAPSTTGSGSGSRAQRPSAEALREALARHGGNVTHVAEALGAARHSVYRWCRELGLDPSSFRGDGT